MMFELSLQRCQIPERQPTIDSILKTTDAEEDPVEYARHPANPKEEPVGRNWSERALNAEEEDERMEEVYMVEDSDSLPEEFSVRRNTKTDGLQSTISYPRSISRIDVDEVTVEPECEDSGQYPCVNTAEDLLETTASIPPLESTTSSPQYEEIPPTATPDEVSYSLEQDEETAEDFVGITEATMKKVVGDSTLKTSRRKRSAHDRGIEELSFSRWSIRPEWKKVPSIEHNDDRTFSYMGFQFYSNSCTPVLKPGVYLYPDPLACDRYFIFKKRNNGISLMKCPTEPDRKMRNVCFMDRLHTESCNLKKIGKACFDRLG